jgi:hypothetical protein
MFVTLGIQNAIRVRRILRHVASTALQYFSVLSHNRHDFRKTKIIESKICVLISLQRVSET